jgi:hypothetical protein
MKLGALLFVCISPFLNILIDSNLVQAVNGIMSYLFTTYCFGWLSKILVAICSTITIIKPTVEASTVSTGQTLQAVIGVIKEHGINAHEFALNIGTYAITMFSQMSPAILEGFLVFFTNYAATTASSVYKYLQTKIGASATTVGQLITKILGAWTGQGKQLVEFDRTSQALETLQKATPIMIVDEGKQAVASELIKYFLDMKGEFSKEFNEPEKTQATTILTTDNSIFNYAISMNDKGQYFIDPNVIHENLQNMMQINITEIIDETVSASVENVTKTFTDNFETALRAAGLAGIVGVMSTYSNSENSNIPGMILLHIFQAEKVIESISKFTDKKFQIILCIALVCLSLTILTIR